MVQVISNVMLFKTILPPRKCRIKFLKYYCMHCYIFLVIFNCGFQFSYHAVSVKIHLFVFILLFNIIFTTLVQCFCTYVDIRIELFKPGVCRP